MRIFIFGIVLTFLFSCSSVQAQSLDEYQLKQQKELDLYEQKHNNGTAQLENNYAEYISKRDREWSDFLRKEWENHKVVVGKVVPQKPKPDLTPTYIPPTTPIDPQCIPIKPVVIPQVAPAPKPQPIVPICKPAEQDKNTKTAQLSFYGKQLTITYDINLGKCAFTTVNQEAITSFWENVSAVNYTPVVARLVDIKKEMRLNDYAYFELIQQFSKEVYPSSTNQDRLLSWFLMVRSGYGVRVAFHADEIALLIPIQEQMYLISYMTLGDKQYYLFPKLAGGSYFTYDKDYSSGAQSLSLNILNPIHFSEKKANKELNFKFENKNYLLHIAYDPDLIDFYKTYPQAEIRINFQAASSTQAKQSLATALKPYTSQMDELKAVNFLLHFVQTAFEYKTDEEQFGKEKYFFADELFYYPYSDCEDRSVLFSYLVRELMGLKVIGLSYPNHISTAVAFNSTVTGDYLRYKNKNYVVSDPTYIGAPVGLTMPQFKNSSPIVVEIE